MFISEIIKKVSNVEAVSIINEQEFDVFAPISDIVDGKKCVFLKDRKYLSSSMTNTSMVITTNEMAKRLKDDHYGICVTDNPRGLFFACLESYEKTDSMEKKDTVIGSRCRISRNASISSYNVEIGDDVVIDDYVKIEPNTIIGSGVTIQAGAKVGIQGYAIYFFDGKVKQSICRGKVVIEDGVLIGSNVVIERALYNYAVTRIGVESFIASNSVIQHNTKIGARVKICAGVNIAGNVDIGDEATIYVGANIANRIKIGERSVIGIGSVLLHNVTDDRVFAGNPAREIK